MDNQAFLSMPPGTWFDGKCWARRPVRLDWDATHLRVTPVDDTGASFRVPLSTIQRGEAWAPGPVPLALAGHGTLWIDPGAHGGLKSLLKALAPVPWPARLSASWAGALASALMLIVVAVWVDRSGVGWLASQVVRWSPPSVDRWIGDRLEASSASWLRPSKLAPSRQAALTTRFAQFAAQAAPGQRWRLVFRRLKDEAGFNAFALPNGTLVVLDGLASALTDDEVMTVLAHELGHAVHRHGLRSVAQTLGLAAVSSAVLGDFSSGAATVASGMQSLRHSREAEREADAFALAAMQRGGVPVSAWNAVMDKFAAREREVGVDGVPGWLSTHPPTPSRRHLEAASPSPPAAPSRAQR